MNSALSGEIELPKVNITFYKLCMLFLYVDILSDILFNCNTVTYL